MRITPIQNYGYSIKFTGSAQINPNWRESYVPSGNNNDNTKKDLPEWIRKSVLFGLITLAIVNDPLTRQYLKPDDIKQQEKYLNEYFEDVKKLGYTVPAHHLNVLADVDKPIIKSARRGNYNLELTLDKGKKIEFDVNTIEKNDSLLYGYFKSQNGTLLKYKAVFNPENPEEFEVFIRNKENKKYIFGRKPNGLLYKVENGKKIVLNKQNAKIYQEELDNQKILDDFEFFSNKNDLWRKLNLILLFFLILNEFGHDLRKREKANKK